MKSGSLSVLLIEDSPSDAMLLRALLKDVEELDFNVTDSGTLADGLLTLGREKFDAIILDLGLPDSVGLGTYTRIRSQAETTPVIIVTGNDDREILAEALHEGADNYLIKDGFDGNRVAIAVIAAIKNRKNSS